MSLLDVFACLFAKVYIVHFLLAYILTWCCCSVSSLFHCLLALFLILGLFLFSGLLFGRQNMIMIWDSNATLPVPEGRGMDEGV